MTVWTTNTMSVLTLSCRASVWLCNSMAWLPLLCRSSAYQATTATVTTFSCTVLEHLALTAGYMSWSVHGWQTSQSCTPYSASCMQHTRHLGTLGTFW